MSKATKPSEITLPPKDLGWGTVLNFLIEKFHRIDAAIWQQRVADGKVCWFGGEVISANTAFLPSRRVCYYREVVAEPVIPFAHQILYQDEHIIVACKPHFLPVTPGGEFVNECLLERVKRDTGLHDVVAVHRLDKETAGLVLFSVNSQSRPLYYQLFAQGHIRKSYQAVARLSEELQPLELPQSWQVKNRLEKSTPAFLMQPVEGDVNAFSSLTLVEKHAELGLFELCPHTGKTHQLRLHMLSVGCPILFDKYYPELLPKQQTDFAEPLQLLAKRLSFVDPATGLDHQFESTRQLQSWPVSTESKEN
ncbi:pseudouridine synthase [Rheinheimera soli]|uniref:tRNA pseudouridine32 synthase/23S rRNA pseudouridine746 synthase n=1 Tax=Rheinheimera soli TaxID=443616 RepID=A0ABU1W438_9GAMM|nr:pseudouridine synthase [Rheinheimera soli]MDR7122560.1 tRNA pseudouridine32 synthase/23S rRNA pseudouridine746 synthase [Rheinheimera soli]